MKLKTIILLLIQWKFHCTIHGERADNGTLDSNENSMLILWKFPPIQIVATGVHKLIQWTWWFHQFRFFVCFFRNYHTQQRERVRKKAHIVRCMVTEIGKVVKHSDAKLEQWWQVACNKNDTYRVHNMLSCVNLILPRLYHDLFHIYLFNLNLNFIESILCFCFCAHSKNMFAYWKLNAPAIEQQTCYTCQRRKKRKIHNKRSSKDLWSSRLFVVVHNAHATRINKHN